MKWFIMLALSTAMVSVNADDKAPQKAAAPAKEAAKAAPAKDAQPAAAAAQILDLNSAKQEELEALPAIGKVKAAKIIAARPFKGKDELVGKKILTDAEYAKVKELVIAKQK